MLAGLIAGTARGGPPALNVIVRYFFRPDVQFSTIVSGVETCARPAEWLRGTSVHRPMVHTSRPNNTLRFGH